MSRRRTVAPLLLFCSVALSHSDTLAEITVQPSGVITCASSDPETVVRYGFGLPPIAPEKQGFESPRIPIVNTTWSHEGIQYSQTVFLSRLDSGDLLEAGRASAPGVLFVRLTGLNTTNEYTLAKAALRLERDGAPCPLELRDQLVYSTAGTRSQFIAALDLPSGASNRAAEGHLEFEGKMPPGTSGSLVIRIPIGRFDAQTQTTRLQDLDFDEEYQRVKKFWTARAKEEAPASLPLCLPERER